MKKVIFCCVVLAGCTASEKTVDADAAAPSAVVSAVVTTAPAVVETAAPATTASAAVAPSASAAALPAKK